MSFGKGSTTVTPTLTPEQKEMLKSQTEFFTGTIKPTYETIVKGATDVYNVNQPGINYAAQNLAGTAAQAQRVLGETGESGLRTGMMGLQNLFTPEYEARQLQAALQPAQAQYAQNIAAQQAQFGGAGQLGSARQALANRATAGATQAAQMKAATDVESQIAAQRMAAAQALIGAGQGGIGQALGAAGTQVQAAGVPISTYNQFASVPFGAPQGSYLPEFAGTQGSQSNRMNFGVNLNPTNLFGGFGG